MTICVTYDNLKILRMISNYHLIKKIDKKSNIIITIYTKHIILNMEHTNLVKSIINYAFDVAIEKDNMAMIEKCLSEGAVVTSTSVNNFQRILSRDNDDSISDDSTDSERVERHKKIFESMLLKNGFEIMTDNITFMYVCVIHDDEYYIKSIIDSGYNGNHTKAPKLLEFMLSAYQERASDCLEILLDNGFDQHIQPLLMYCVQNDMNGNLALFIRRGANCYSILHDLHAYVLSQERCSHYALHNIKIVLENMYRIEMLREPIFKYFLIRSINHDVPIEIFVYVLKMYMLLDYACSNNIRAKLPGLVAKKAPAKKVAVKKIVAK